MIWGIEEWTGISWLRNDVQWLAVVSTEMKFSFIRNRRKLFSQQYNYQLLKLLMMFYQ